MTTDPAPSPLDTETRQALNGAGLSEADLDLLVAHRWREQVSAIEREPAELIEKAAGLGLVDVGAFVPPAGRQAKGERITPTDLVGFERVVAASIAHAAAEVDRISEPQTRDAMYRKIERSARSGARRRIATGDAETLRQVIETARGSAC